MKNFNKGSNVLSISLILGLVVLIIIVVVRGIGSGGPEGKSQSAAAISADLSSAGNFAVLASTYTNTVTGTTINGDVGFTTGPAVAPTGTHTNYGNAAPYSTAGGDQGSALSSLNAQVCDFNFGSPTDLSLLSQPLAPGVYCITAATSIGTGGISLSSSGVYVFRIDGALTTVANSNVDGSACNVFWTPTGATTLGANSTFVGTVIDNSGITVGSTVSWTGRALAFGGTVTTDADTITVPTCTNAVPLPPAETPTPNSETTPELVPVTTLTPVAPAVTPAPPVFIPNLPRTGYPPKGE